MQSQEPWAPLHAAQNQNEIKQKWKIKLRKTWEVLKQKFKKELKKIIKSKLSSIYIINSQKKTENK